MKDVEDIIPCGRNRTLMRQTVNARKFHLSLAVIELTNRTEFANEIIMRYLIVVAYRVVKVAEHARQEVLMVALEELKRGSRR